MYLKYSLCLVALTVLVGCGETSDQAVVVKKKPVELTVSQRLDIERNLQSTADSHARKIKSTPGCQAYADKVQAILSVTAEAAERRAGLDATMREANASGCLNK